jgi:hypothetical protein
VQPSQIIGIGFDCQNGSNQPQVMTFLSDGTSCGVRRARQAGCSGKRWNGEQ